MGKFQLDQTNKQKCSFSCSPGRFQTACAQRRPASLPPPQPSLGCPTRDLLTLGEAEESETFKILEDGGTHWQFPPPLGRRAKQASHCGPTLGLYRKGWAGTPNLTQRRRTFPPRGVLASCLLIFPNSYFEIGS